MRFPDEFTNGNLFNAFGNFEKEIFRILKIAINHIKIYLESNKTYIMFVISSCWARPSRLQPDQVLETLALDSLYETLQLTSVCRLAY